MLQYLNQFIVVQRDLVFWGWPTERSVRNNHRSLFNNQEERSSHVGSILPKVWCLPTKLHGVTADRASIFSISIGVCQETSTEMLCGTVIVNDLQFYRLALTSQTVCIILVSVTKLILPVLVAMWMRESGLGPPTHVRANSKPAASRAPSKALTSQARIGQVRLVTFHTWTSLTHWNPSPAVHASQTRACMGHLTL